VVPGITAATGGLAYAGIPVTHRDVNTAVTFITGHNVTGKVPDDLDWPALARGAPVLVFYMALKHLDEITARLIAGGRDADEPAAIVTAATTGEQRVIETTLSAAPDRAHEVSPPALFVVGDVVRLRAGLDWLGALSGKVLDADPLDLRTDRDAG
jgi:uroporphyrin-III C-methyltransferase